MADWAALLGRVGSEHRDVPYWWVGLPSWLGYPAGWIMLEGRVSPSGRITPLGRVGNAAILPMWGEFASS